MSEEIMFSDMLNHYSLKLTEVSDLLANTVGYLNKSLMISNDSWVSYSSDIYNEKIIDSKKYISNINNALDQMLALLNTVKNNAIDSEIEMLNDITENAAAE